MAPWLIRALLATRNSGRAGVIQTFQSAEEVKEGSDEAKESKRRALSVLEGARNNAVIRSAVIRSVELYCS